MGVLKIYRNFSEKKNIYPVQLIKDKSSVDELIGDLVGNERKSIWRGMPESNFKHYTSLQRFWIEADLRPQHGEIEKYLKHIYAYAKGWNRNFFKRYLSNYGISVFSILSALSVLRHHGAPTPLLDWSRSPLVALFFAAHSSNYHNTDCEIEQYFSLYEMTEKHPVYNLDTRGLVLKHVKEREAILRSYNPQATNNPHFAEQFSEAYVNDEELFFERSGLMPCFMIQDLPNDPVKYFVSNNYNITNQEGLFICNLYPLDPLEDAIKLRIQQKAKELNIAKTDLNKEISRHKKSFVSYDFHKSLKFYILKKLDELGINEKYIFPNLNEMAIGCVKSYLESRDY